jgi:hypothetical protein
MTRFQFYRAVVIRATSQAWHRADRTAGVIGVLTSLAWLVGWKIGEDHMTIVLPAVVFICIIIAGFIWFAYDEHRDEMKKQAALTERALSAQKETAEKAAAEHVQELATLRKEIETLKGDRPDLDDERVVLVRDRLAGLDDVQRGLIRQIMQFGSQDEPELRDYIARYGMSRACDPGVTLSEKSGLLEHAVDGRWQIKATLVETVRRLV